MKVVFKQDYIKFSKTYKKGVELYVSADFAETLISRGIAEEYVEPKKEFKKVKSKLKK